MSANGRNPKQRLVSLGVDEISLVDRPAIEEKFVVIKSEEPMADKIPETHAPATGTAPAVAAVSSTPAAPAPGAVQAVENVQKTAKLSPEQVATCKSAAKTLTEALASVATKKVKKAAPRFEHIVATAKAKAAELEAVMGEVEKASLPPEMEGMGLLAQAQISKLHGCLYDLEMMVASLMAMAQSDEAGEPAEKAQKSETPAAQPAATAPAVPPAPVAKGRILSAEELAKVKAAIDKAMEPLQDVVHGADPMQFVQLFPVGADGQPSGAPQKDDGKTPSAPAMGAVPYTADTAALTKAVEDAVAPLKKALEQAQKTAADAVERAKKLESATGVSKSLPAQEGEAKPVAKKQGLWKGIL
jgi:hypothetical protein